MNPIHAAYHNGPRCNPHCPGPFSSYHEGYADGLAAAAAAIDSVVLGEAIDSIAWPESTSPLGYGSGIWIREFADAIARRYRELGHPPRDFGTQEMGTRTEPPR